MSESSGSGKKSLFVAPNFHKPLRDLSTSQGECLVLECRFKGVPPPQITWKREGHVIEDSVDFRILHKGEVSTLVIGEAFPEDTGLFTCEATNKAGTATTSCKIVVKGGNHHSISTKSAATGQSFHHPRPTQVLPAKQTEISLTSSSDSSYPTEKQTHISQFSLTPVNPKTNVYFESNTVGINGTIPARIGSPHTSPQSSACVVPSQNANDNFEAFVRNTTPSPKSLSTTMAQPSFNSSPFDEDEALNFKKEKNELIQAVSESFNAPKQKQKGYNSSRELARIERDIEFRLAQTGLSSDALETLDSNSNKDQTIKQQSDYILYSPTLAAILELEPQEYKVSASDQRLMNEIEYRLERTLPVNEDPDDAIFEKVPESQQIAPIFIAKLKSLKAINATSGKFTCRISAKPKAKVFWFKDGKQISKRSKHYLQRTDGVGSHELYIPQLHIEDDGNYTALAINPKGRISNTGRLSVISEKWNSASNETGSSAPLVSKQNLTNPRMMSPLSHSKNITSSHSPGMTSSRVTSAVFSTPKTLPEKGQLADDEECPVDKYYRPTIIQKPSENVKTEEGKLVRLDVKVTGLPSPMIEWLINNRPVKQDALHKILVRENCVHSLLLERASPMDEGKYTIKASNKAGIAEAHVQLHVAPREHLKVPAFIQRLSGCCVAEGEPVRLEVRVVSTPQAVITWKRDSDQVVPDGRVQLYEDESGYVCLQITQTRLTDAAWYTCSAANKAGISNCKCKLDVYSPASNLPSNKKRIRTPNRYANLAKVAGVEMRDALTPDTQSQRVLPESEEL